MFAIEQIAKLHDDVKARDAEIERLIEEVNQTKRAHFSTLEQVEEQREEIERLRANAATNKKNMKALLQAIRAAMDDVTRTKVADLSHLIADIDAAIGHEQKPKDSTNG